MLFTLAIAGALLVGLLMAERRQSLKNRLFFKPLLSSLFVITALFQPLLQNTYGAWIMAGLILSLAGDVSLAVPGRKIFMTGMVLFMGAHVMYICGFSSLADLTNWRWEWALMIAAAGCGVYAWLYPHLGALKLPVAAYVAVISLMLLGAMVIAWDTTLPMPGRRAVLLGAMLFYLSDLFVARNRFMGIRFINRLIGLPLYYTGQFLLAYSIGMVVLPSA
jgi:uncharacterized membrane protein YhhN